MLSIQHARRQVNLAADRMFRKYLIPLVVAVGLPYLALLAYVYSIQDRLAFYPIQQHVQSPADYGIAAQEHTVPTRDGNELDAWLIQGDARPQPFVLLYSHGNAGNLSHNLASLRQLQALGLSVFIYDYRGYGGSTGSPDEAGLYMDAEAAYEYLRDTLGVPADRVILYGRSLGGAMAVHLATTRPARALILESTFTSAVDVGAEVDRYLPVRLLVRHRFESLERLQNHELKNAAGDALPLLIVHSRPDSVIPFAHAPRLLDAARTSRKTLVALDAGGHNDAFLVSRNKYERAFVQFLNGLSKPHDANADRP